MTSSRQAAVARAIGTVGGLGYLRPGPGTWGSAATCIVIAVLTMLTGPWGATALFIVAAIGGIWAARNVLSFATSTDPGEVVIDEVAGQTIALAPAILVSSATGHVLPLWPMWLAGFLLFRLFDIWKPSLIGRVDRAGGVLGLMADDLLAGAAAALCLLAGALLWLGGWPS